MTTHKNGLLAFTTALVIAASAVLSVPARAGSVSIPLPPLPPIPHIKLSAPPLMVWLPTPAVYVAMDTPAPIFCHQNRYYLRSNNGWYVGPGYEGPWASVQVNLLPPGLRGYHDHDWNRYQHEAHYWRAHEHREHPRFYGRREHDHRDAQVPHSDRDDGRGWREHTDLYEPNRPGPRTIPEHDLRRPDSRSERPTHFNRQEHFYRQEPVQLHGLHRGPQGVRTQYHGDARGRDQGHWRMKY